MFGGQVGLAGHIKIGDKVGIGAQAGVPGNVKSNEQILGTPAIDAKNFMKSSASIQKTARNLHHTERHAERNRRIKKTTK